AATDHDGSPDMQVHLARRTRPRAGRDPTRRDDSRYPLKGHEVRERAVGLPKDLIACRGKQLRGADACGGGVQLNALGSRSAQPKTGVAGSSAFPAESNARSALRPALSPACPRLGVMPPAKRSSPAPS